MKYKQIKNKKQCFFSTKNNKQEEEKYLKRNQIIILKVIDG